MLSRTSPFSFSRSRMISQWVLAAVLGIAGSGAALAQTQTQAQCDQQTNLGVNAQLRVTQNLGRALVEITKPNSAGRKVDIEYGDEMYSFKMGNDGRLRAGFVLTEATSQFTISMSETAPITCEVTVPDFNKLHRVVLRWRDPVQLDLNVIEPGGRMGETGHINAMRPNTNMSHGIGQMDVVGSAPAEGATAELSYVVPNSSLIPPNSTFTYKIDYVTRGLQPEAPYCEDHALGSPQVEFVTIEGGKVSTRKMGVSRARCREKIAEYRRYMPIR